MVRERKMIYTIPQIINSLSRGLGSKQYFRPEPPWKEEVPPEWDYEDWAYHTEENLKDPWKPLSEQRPDWEWDESTYVYMNAERDVAIWAADTFVEFNIGPLLITVYEDGTIRSRIVPMSHEDGQKGITGDGN
jgi:hypothetical protein